MPSSASHVRRIVNLDLEAGPNVLDVPPGDGGCYALLWVQRAVLGCLDIDARGLPIGGSRLATEISQALAPHIGDTGGLPTGHPWPKLKEAWLSALPQRAATPAAASADAGISIVVCTRDRPEKLAICLAGLGDVVSPRDEVIVVDNNPADVRTRAATLAAAAHCPSVRHVAEARAGLDIARNTGVLASNRPIVAFIDDDVRIHPAWRDRMAAAFVDPQVDAVTGLVLPEVLQTEAQYLFERYWSFNKGFRPVRYDPAYLARHRRLGAPVWEIGAGASMAFRRKVLLRVGLFDERLDAGAAGCNGDSEIWYRILAAGGVCLYEPAIIAFHTHRRSIEGLRRQLKAYMRGHAVALLIQHERTGHRGNLRRALVAMPKYYARLALLGLRDGWPDRFKTFGDEVVGYLDGFRFYLTTRRPKSRVVPAASAGPCCSGLLNRTSTFSPKNRVAYLKTGLPNGRPGSEVDGTQVNTTRSRSALDAAGSVAVVITTYNHAAFLDDAIRSVIRQSIPADEIMVVDDGSTDHPEVVVSRYPHVRLIRQRNQGLSAARNTGLRAAASDKIIFLDADDRLCQGAIKAGLECFVRHLEAGFVYGGFQRIDAGGGETGEPICRDAGPDPHLTFLQGNAIGMHATVLYNRRHLLTAGGFDVTLRRCEDYDVYLRLSRIHPVANHRQTVAEYRRDGTNMSSNSLEMLRCAQRVLERYRPPGRSGSAVAAWRQGQANWRYYYVNEILSGGEVNGTRLPEVHRIADAMRASPTVAARYLTQRLKRALPPGMTFTLKCLMCRQPSPPLARVRFGDFNRTSPISPDFGFDRGTPVDRYYIEAFLAAHRGDIRGRALEVGDASYCRRFGTGIVRQDVLDLAAGNPEATIVGDLSVPGVLPEAAFDCLVVTQALHLIHDVHAAVAEMHRALKPGGVLLLTCPGISQVDRGRSWGASSCWSINRPAAERRFAEVFGAANVVVEVRGNVYAAVCFLQGLALQEVDVAKLEVLDTSYPVIVTVRARKPEEG